MAACDSLPDFIQFLFSSKPKFDCYFKVGNATQGEPERIGAVKLMLMAHSEVFRAELEYSDLKEKDEVPIKDIHPETFKGMLKYVYGNDTTQEMCFDEADNLLYVAEKYMIKTLKNKLATRLMKLLNTDNICSLLNNPACHTHLELNSAITDILRYETDSVLASPQFLWMNADSFLRILEQDGLAVPEIELWRAAIKWAKHRANSEDGQELRQQLSGLTQHFRPFTLSAVEFCEVVSSKVLTKDEIEAVCLYQHNGKPGEVLSEFSNEIEPRKLLQRKQAEVSLANLYEMQFISSEEYTFTMLSKRNSIELLPLVCRSYHRDNKNPEHWTYKVDCITTVTKEVNPDDPDSSSDSEPPTVVTFSEKVKYGVDFDIPLAVDGKNITLQPDTKYTVKIVLNGTHRQYYSKEPGKANSEDNQELRHHLSGLTQHFRLLTLSAIESLEVISSKVLTKDEIEAVSLYQLNRKPDESQDLSDFSKEIKPRKLLQGKVKWRKKGELLLAELNQTSLVGNKEYKFTLLTKKNSIELLPLVCRSYNRVNDNPEHWTYKVDCTITITKEANPDDPDSSSDSEPPTVVTFSEKVKYGVDFDIPLAVDGKNITLQPDTKYTVNVVLSGRHSQFYSTESGKGKYENDHLTLYIRDVARSGFRYEFPSSKLQYRLVTE